jgi:hypothetical protein
MIVVAGAAIRPEVPGLNHTGSSSYLRQWFLFCGFLGLGNDHYPLPWQSLKYDTSLGGYITGLTESKLQGAPKYANENSWNWSDPRSTKTVNDYYGVAV